MDSEMADRKEPWTEAYLDLLMEFLMGDRKESWNLVDSNVLESFKNLKIRYDTPRTRTVRVGKLLSFENLLIFISSNTAIASHLIL